MKYVLLIAMTVFSASAAFAADPSTSATKRLEGRHDVNFSCFFRSHLKKGLRCEARGEVCVNFRRDLAGNLVREGCDRDRDDNRVRFRCNNGFTDDDRARARIVRDRNERRGEDLLISAVESDRDDVIAVEEFERFDGDSRLPAFLSLEGAELRGECRVALERDLDLGIDLDQQ